MFDAGFLELMVVFVVALLVIGPERMPEAVRNVLSVIRTVKRSLHNARMEIEKQVGADDIRRQLHNEEIMRSLRESKEAIENAVQENTGNMREPIEQLVDDVHKLTRDVQHSLDEDTAVNENASTDAGQIAADSRPAGSAQIQTGKHD